MASNSIVQRTLPGAFATVAMMIGVPLQAQVTVNESVSVSGNPSVRVEALVGDIVIVGGGSGSVQVTGTRGEDTEGLEVVVDGGEVLVRVLYPEENQDQDSQMSVDLQVTVPTGSSVGVDVLSVDLDVSGVTGDVSVDVASGDVMITGSPARVDAELLSGDLDIEVSGAPVVVSIAAGDLNVTGAAGTLEVESLTGDVTLQGRGLDRVDATSSAGDLGVDVSMTAGGVIRMEALSGDAVLTIPGSASAALEVRTFSGEITTDFGADAIQSSRMSPGESLRTTIGSGAGRIEIQTFSGDVVIRRAG